MSRTYPVKFRRRSNANDIPTPLAVVETIGIFTAADLWHSSEGCHGAIEFPASDTQLANNVTLAINLAYEKGRADMRAEIRALLGLSKEAEE